jgi:hypothetical protein
MAANPLFASMAALSLALGIGANTGLIDILARGKTKQCS